MTGARTNSRTIEVVMPQLGESVDSGTITRWLKAPGEAVEVDEPLYELHTDKATMEVPSLVAGHVRQILAQEGTPAPVGSVLALITAQGERLSPVVRRLLREHGLEASALDGSAQNGRVTKNDVLAHLRARPESAPVMPATPSTPAKTAVPAMRAMPAQTETSRRIPLSHLQLRAGERLGTAQKNAVNVFSVVEIDLEAVAAERVRRGLTYLPFIARATTDALRAHTLLNASLDEAKSEIVCHADVHLGIAVDLAEGGLVVPVVRNAQRLSLDGFAAEIARLADGARSSKLRPQEYAGSTFTISNNGGFGTLLTAAVINIPNVAIVSTDAVELRPVVVERTIVIRHRMYFCMTWDHRAFNGSTAAAFLTRVKHNLETWDWTTQ